VRRLVSPSICATYPVSSDLSGYAISTTCQVRTIQRTSRLRTPTRVQISPHLHGYTRQAMYETRGAGRLVEGVLVTWGGPPPGIVSGRHTGSCLARLRIPALWLSGLTQLG
jgi:hypothetical protein